MSLSNSSDNLGLQNSDDDYFNEPVDDSYFDNSPKSDSRRRSAEGVYNPFDSKEIKFDSMEKPKLKTPDYKINLPQPDLNDNDSLFGNSNNASPMKKNLNQQVIFIGFNFQKYPSPEDSYL